MSYKPKVENWDAQTKNVPEIDIPIKGAVNIKTRPISNFDVRLAYGDLTLIIAMIHDYIKDMDMELSEGTLGIDPNQYEAYYRPKFLGIADRISQQIDYDYDKQVEKCQKKMSKNDDNNDVGEESLALTVKRGREAKKEHKHR